MIPAPRAPDGLEQPEDLVGLAAVGQRDDDVAGLDDAEVAVNRFGGMEEEGRGAGAGQRRGDLPRDDARLAHARDDDAATAIAEQLDGPDEPGVEAVDQREDGRGLGLQHLARQREVGHDGARRPIRTLGRWHR